MSTRKLMVVYILITDQDQTVKFVKWWWVWNVQHTEMYTSLSRYNNTAGTEIVGSINAHHGELLIQYKSIQRQLSLISSFGRRKSA